MLIEQKVLAYALTLLCILQLFNVCLSDNSKEITLKHGRLSGKIATTFFKHEKYYSFQGIPYAEPPIGKLRFKPPIPLASWQGTYDAHHRKPTCMQASARQRNNEKMGYSGSEDCLYLSVFTPALDKNLAIIVFDYSDNFRTGFNTTATYSPDFFMEENVIVVTISHRLSLFGYLNTEDDVIPGNAGLKDFILGLQWVQDNIIHFGGDPKKVTLMGSRGGAVLADMLLYSEKAKGLFSAVTLQSGTSLEAVFFPENTRRDAFAIGEAFNVTTDDSTILLEALQKIDALDLIKNEHKYAESNTMESYQRTVFPFAPVIEMLHEDAVLTSLPDKSKVINDVPILVGFNSREGLDLVSHYLFEPRLVEETNKDFFFHFPIRTNFSFDRNSQVYHEALSDINQFYFKDGYFNVNNILEYSQYVGDVLQIYALNHAVRKLSKELHSPVFYYVFDFNGAFNENFVSMMRYARGSMNKWGATITDELCYLQLCSRIKKNYEEIYKLVSKQPEQTILQKMTRMWANFAKTRNPTPQGDDILKNLSWEPVNKDEAEFKYLHISKKITTKSNPIEKRIEFWDEFLAKYAEKAVDGVVGDVGNKKHVEL